MDGDFDLGENPAISEIKALNKKVSELEMLIERFKQVIVENELEEELEGIDCTSIEEKICRDGIRHIASLVEGQDYDKNDITSFQILYNTLRAIRGRPITPAKNVKGPNIKELLKIVKDVK